jgi:O-antigen biosynthesis protein WbqP
MFRRVVAIILLVILSPLFVLIALLILIEDGSPIFFQQKRVGANCSFFRILKFRTMKKETPNVATHLLDNPEQYILKVGSFLRKSSLDELPNLINIMQGEMAFIGPRPALFNQNDLMELRVLHGIHVLMPGITGWAQINGRDEISIAEKVELEKEYLNNQSLKVDCIILFKTVFNILSIKDVSH